MNRVLKLMYAVLATTTVVAGCTDYESSTSLNPDGPPMVEQVRLKESYAIGANMSERRVFGFGTHPDALEAMVHPVTSARVKGNAFRVIMDELLVGNSLEEVGCRAVIDTDAYSRVPVGSTPDDIARCATAQDVLPSTCKGEHAVCICDLDAGCNVIVAGSPTPVNVPKGGPVGIDDKNQDGAADDTRLIRDSVGVTCGTINVPMDLDMSYWNPSGNQQVPAMGGFDALGPAIVLIPQAGLPSNIDCQLTFAADVVDKQGIRVCAPPGGDILSDCSPGDTTKVAFKTEPMYFLAAFNSGATGISKTDPITFAGITPLDPSATTAVTTTTGGTPVAGVTVTIPAANKDFLLVTPPVGGFAPNTTYTITLTTGVKDAFMQALPAPFVLTFTTGA